MYNLKQTDYNSAIFLESVLDDDICTMIWSLCSISIITSSCFNEHQPYTPVSFIPAPMQILYCILIWTCGDLTKMLIHIFQHAILTFFGWISGFDICDETDSSHECNLHFFCTWVLTVEKYKKANPLVGVNCWTGNV